VKVLLDLEGSLARRVAALLTDSGDEVASYRRPISGLPTILDSDRWDAVIGVDDSGSYVRSLSDSGLVTGAGVLGLALATSALSGGAALVAVTGEKPGGEVAVTLPPPIGTVMGWELDADGFPAHRLVLLESQENWAGFVVETAGRRLAMVDDRRFVEAIALAAAIHLPPGPVWEHADDYLKKAESLGLVVAESG